MLRCLALLCLPLVVLAVAGAAPPLALADSVALAALAAPMPGTVDAALAVDPIRAGDDPTVALSVMVALEGPTALDQYRARGFVVGDTGSKAQRALDDIYAGLAARQAPARHSILRSGARLVSTYDTAYNGFLVHATRGQVARFAGAPGVRLVYRAPEWEPLLDDAVPHVGAERALTELGIGGKDVRIAIIDTGIDYFHKSFGGSGRAKDFTDDNPDVTEAGTFPTDKVVGGYDFAGTDYASNAGQADLREPKPDMDPRDQLGHGTHVAGIAAGERGVTNVYHGAAPDASLISLKVFGGKGGATDLANDGIEWATEANLGRTVQGYCRRDTHNLCRVDVINMSLGASFGAKLSEAEQFVKSAAEAGIVVIAASGNAGDVGYITGSPGGAPYALSVANTIPPGERADKIEATYDGAAHDIEALEAEASLARQMANRPDVRGALVDFGRACPGDPVGGDVKDKVALMSATGCPFLNKVQAAKTAGAVGAVVYNLNESLVRMAAQPGQPAADIPAFMIKKGDADTLAALLRAGTVVDIRFAASFHDGLQLTQIIDTVAASSSRGPSRGGAVKPEISAPGTNIVAPRMGSGKEGFAQSGTSMASPLVAGGAALVVEHLRKAGLAAADRPLGTDGKLGPLDVAALLVNYAAAPVWVADNRANKPAPIALGGVGRMVVDQSIEGQTIVRAGTIASLNFGYRAAADSFTERQPVTIRNIGTVTRRYQVETRLSMSDDAGKGVTYAPAASEVTVDAGGTVTVDVTVAVDPKALKPYQVYGGDRLTNGASGAMADAEMDALVVVTEIDADGDPVEGGDVARVPVYFLPRAATELSLATSPVFVDPGTRRGTARVTNAGKGAGPADLFALVEADEVEGNVDPRLNLDYFGARVVPGTNGARLVEFALHTTGARVIPVEGQAQVWLDTNRDGTFEWLVYNADPALLLGQSANGQHASVLRNVVSTNPIQLGGQLTLVWADADIHSRTLILRADAARLGFAPGTPVAFNVVAVMVAGIEDVRGGEAMKNYDAMPDDGWTDSGVPGAGRLTFDDARVARCETWRFTVAGESAASVQVTLPAGGDGGAPRRLLAVYPFDEPGEGDAEMAEVVVGIGPSVTPTAGPTRTSGPTGTPGPTNTPGPTPEPGSTFDVFLPALMRHGSWR